MTDTELTPAEMSDALAAFGQIGVIRRGFDAADKIRRLVETQDGTLKAIERQIAERRAELAAARAETIESAKAEAQVAADKITSDARAEAQRIVDEAERVEREAKNAVAELRREHDRMSGEITRLRGLAQSIVG